MPSCTNGCAGTCNTNCTGGCGSGCSYGCSTGCKNGCSGECKSACQGAGYLVCSACQQGCSVVCAEGCYSKCKGCSGCGDNCSSGCGGSCDNSCVGCTRTCDSYCTSGAKKTTYEAIVNLPLNEIIYRDEVNDILTLAKYEVTRRGKTATNATITKFYNIDPSHFTAIKTNLNTITANSITSTYSQYNKILSSTIKAMRDKACAFYRQTVNH